MEIYVDADACPVKDEIVRVAERHGIIVHMVSNRGIRPSNPALVRNVIIADGLDVADDWIAEHYGAADIPLATRDLMTHLRETGEVTGGGGPAKSG